VSTFRHVYQYSDDWDSWNALRAQFREFRGLCWLACLHMAVEATTKTVPKNEILGRLIDATVKVDRSKILLALQELEKTGVDTKPFFESDVLSFIDLNTGGFDALGFVPENPGSFDCFFNHLLDKAGLDVKIETITTRNIAGAELVGKIKETIDVGGVAIIAVKVANFQTERTSGHVVMVSESTKTKLGRYFLVSDPDFDRPAIFPEKYLEFVIDNGFDAPGVRFESHELLFLIRKRT